MVDISDALFVLRLQSEKTQIQCEDGARDVNNIWVIAIIVKFEMFQNDFLLPKQAISVNEPFFIQKSRDDPKGVTSNTLKLKSIMYPL